MKLTYEDKLEIYKLRKNGMSWYLKYNETYECNGTHSPQTSLFILQG